uniref:Histone-lysine N-methyltransferase 2C-like n=1 Tax=Petromyzon marinus TaxID=7757 RepID=A0AAJ7WZY3_PETMA|nr:histone-lysine N-methyltransferase 2C-like [Petromyzon marinus]
MESDGEAGTAAPQAGGASERRARGRPRKDGVLATPTQRPAKTRGAGRLRATGDGDSNGRNGTGDVGDDMTTEEADVKEGSMAEGGEPSPPPCPSTGTEEPSPGQGPSPQAECSNDTLGHRCAFCHCGGESLLGQGDLTCCGPTPGFMPSYRRSSPRARRDEGSDTERPAARTRRSDSAGAGGLTEVTPPRCKRGSLDTAELAGGEKSPRQSGVGRGNKREQCKSPQRTPPGPPQNELRGVGDLWDELSRVGLPDDVDTQILFNTTGHCWAHHCCAAWSEGVCMAEDEALLNVDKAVLVGLTQRCAYCRRLGATIKCWEEKCRQFYHYPCAAGAGTFQDIQSLTLLCPDHLEQAVELVGEEAECAICDSPGDVSDQLFCTSCGQHYHGACLEIVPTPSKRVGWQCPDCKICQTCKESGDDSKMLVCDTCGQGLSHILFATRP